MQNLVNISSQKQNVWLSRVHYHAIVDVLLFDEPTSHSDPEM